MKNPSCKTCTNIKAGIPPPPIIVSHYLPMIACLHHDCQQGPFFVTCPESKKIICFLSILPVINLGSFNGDATILTNTWGHFDLGTFDLRYLIVTSLLAELN